MGKLEMDACGRRYDLTSGEPSWSRLEADRIVFLPSGPDVKAEFEEIKTGLAEELRASEGFKKRELLEPANRYRLLLGFGLFLGQQVNLENSLDPKIVC